MFKWLTVFSLVSKSFSFASITFKFQETSLPCRQSVDGGWILSSYASIRFYRKEKSQSTEIQPSLSRKKYSSTRIQPTRQPKEVQGMRYGPVCIHKAQNIQNSIRSYKPIHKFFFLHTVRSSVTAPTTHTSPTTQMLVCSNQRATEHMIARDGRINLFELIPFN